MAVSLHLKKRDGSSIECWMCTTETTIFPTTVEFTEDGQSYGGISLCVEHMDAIVSAALLRHAAELTLANPRWFEQPDDEAVAEEEAWLQSNST